MISDGDVRLDIATNLVTLCTDSEKNRMTCCEYGVVTASIQALGHTSVYQHELATAGMLHSHG